MPNIYNPDFVTKLFDEMSDSYDRVNYSTSFGFSHRWRRQCVNKASIKPGMVVYDLLGKLFLGNPDNCRMLGVYTEEFGNAKRTEEILSKEGLVVNYHNFFYGCASGISGLKI